MCHRWGSRRSVVDCLPISLHSVRASKRLALRLRTGQRSSSLFHAFACVSPSFSTLSILAQSFIFGQWRDTLWIDLHASEREVHQEDTSHVRRRTLWERLTSGRNDNLPLGYSSSCLIQFAHLRNASMSNALAADAPRRAIDPPKRDVIACRRATEDESTFFTTGMLYPRLFAAKRATTRRMNVVFMFRGLRRSKNELGSSK